MRFLIAGFVMLISSFAYAAVDVSRIFIIANSDSTDSLRLAEFYSRARSIPTENIISVSAGKSAVISRSVYERSVADPVIDALVARGAVSATVIGRSAKYPRRLYAFLSHDVDFIVMCMMPHSVAPTSPKKSPFDGASVDSELAATFIASDSLARSCPNPLFRNYANPDSHKVFGVLRVARLDGDSFATAKKSVESALAAERAGLRGRVYIDKSKKYAMGDRWLDSAASVFRSMYFDVSVDEGRGLFDYYSRMDAAAVYLGWYAANPRFYFLEEGFFLADGAIADHIYSYSAKNLRSSGWTLRFLRCGAAQSFGNVYEPYLSGTHHVDAVAEAYARGMSAGEVAYASVPDLSWQTLVVGDPLYAPFKVGLDVQLAALERGEIDGLSQYVVLREANRRLAKGAGAEEVSKYIESWVGRIPDDALLMRLIDDGYGDSLRHADALLTRGIFSAPDKLGTAFALARFFESRKKYAEAMSVYERLPLSLSDAFKRAVVARAAGLSAKSGLPLSEKFASLKRRFEEIDAAVRAKAAAEKARKDAERAGKSAAPAKK